MSSKTSKKGWAVITGASAGLGVEFARQLARRGYDLVLVARRGDKLATVAAEVTVKHNVKAEVLECDLGLPHASSRLMTELERRGIDIALLVNNAGFGPFGPALDSPIERHTATIQLSVTALTELPSPSRHEWSRPAPVWSSMSPARAPFNPAPTRRSTPRRSRTS